MRLAISIRAKTSVFHIDNCFDSGPCEVDEITSPKSTQVVQRITLHMLECNNQQWSNNLGSKPVIEFMCLLINSVLVGLA